MKKRKASDKCTVLFFLLLNTRNSQLSFQNRESGWVLYSFNSSNSPLTIFWLIYFFSIQVLKSVAGPQPAQTGSPGTGKECEVSGPTPKLPNQELWGGPQHSELTSLQWFCWTLKSENHCFILWDQNVGWLGPRGLDQN